ncbi:signal peptidase I [Virgibacillus profundi]|uniref:Signal peptidase I n=1 Tax=Virgibacillus profundi TaxID=2024555 RepID=A0A2A2IBU3_9BACI|nr:signal peptidase I [Virgibacillus profundi]PAV28786.1 signal peptidase I [Virgibacillus profundi]PXY52954.1 signal peptidase I [Virgibacillus profundi]
MTQAKKKNEWLEWAKAIIIAVLIALFLRSFIFATSIVEGESMDPTLEDGERVIFNKIVYLVDEPERGDIVIIKRPFKNYVKRVIALPGETIEINGSELYIDGEKYKQNFLNEEAEQRTGNFGPIQVPEDSYFVMGDNRAISKDSRNGLGFILEDEIIGRSEFVIFPFDELSKTR